MTGFWFRLTAAMACFKVGAMSDREEFYQGHLDRVSRSFAFCIRQLPSPLRGWVSLSYLLCRILDTIEDAHWDTSDEQMKVFAAFDAALGNAEKVQSLDGWETGFHPSTAESEVALLREAPRLLADYHALPESIRDILREIIGIMSAGMQHFCRTKIAGTLRLKTLAEVNQYCFFVAGVVGELLAKVLASVEPRFSLNRISVLRAHHFGLFLQKVNLLKDQVVDEQSGRHLVPSRDTVEASSAENAREALDFLLAIPNEQVEFRRFCAWSLFLGLEAVNVSRRSAVERRVVKVSRERTDEILRQVDAHIGDNHRLQALFSEFADTLGWRARAHKPAVRTEAPAWLLGLYRGRLDQSDLRQLGVTS